MTLLELNAYEQGRLAGLLGVADEMRQCLFPAVVALRSGKLSKVNKALLRLSALADALARIPVKGAR